MSNLRVPGDLWNTLLNQDLSSCSSFTSSVTKSPTSSPQRRCNCSLFGEERQELFKVQLNIGDFKPEEITVKSDTIKDAPYLIIQGRKKEENGVVPNEFIRRYLLPQEVNMQDFVKDISTNGIITVTAYKKVSADVRKERVSPSRGRYEISEVTRRIILDY